MEQETWKRCSRFYDLEVSDHGRIRDGETMEILEPTRPSKLTLTQKLTHNYYLKFRGMAVHHLIIETFLGPRPEGMVCRHYNDIKSDNRLENLCWGTHNDNMADARRNRLERKNGSGKKKSKTSSKYSCADMKVRTAIRELYKRGFSIEIIMKTFEISRHAVVEILFNHNKRRNDL